MDLCNKNKIVGILERLPESQQLDVNRTYESQRRLVNNTLIPVIQKSINKKSFPVTDGIIKHIIHERHRHKREDIINKRRGFNWNDLEKRRKHANSRRSEVNNKSGYFML